MSDFGFPTLTPLILYALWAVALQFRLALARARAMRNTKRAVNTFKPIGDDEHLDAISRAHMNTVENLPVFAVVYFAAIWLSADAPVAALGWAAFAGRVLQSLAHLASRSVNGVRLRALMLLVQLICFIWLGAASIIAAYAS